MAYNFIPEEKKDILVHPDLKRNKGVQAELVVLFDYLRKHHPGIEKPIAINPTSLKTVKVTRKITSVVPVATIKRSAGLKQVGISPGEGSRGGRGTENKGNAFEQQLLDDIKRWTQGEPIRNPAHSTFIKEFVDHYNLTSLDKVKIIPEGYRNTKRPIIVRGDAVYVGTAGDPDIGEVITDITVKEQIPNKPERTIYLSLKYGPTVTLFNAGIASYITSEDFKKGNIQDKDGKTILKLFGIDEKKFLDVFTGMKTTPKPEDTFSIINKGRLTALIKSGMGYGYHLVHFLNNKIVHFEMTKQKLEQVSRPMTAEVLYGGVSGTAKRVDINVETPGFYLKFNMRNKQGGVNPTFLLCDYKKKH